MSLTNQWTVSELRAMHLEFMATLSDAGESGPYSNRSDSEWYVGQFLNWLESRSAVEPNKAVQAGVEDRQIGPSISDEIMQAIRNLERTHEWHTSRSVEPTVDIAQLQREVHYLRETCASFGIHPARVPDGPLAPHEWEGVNVNNDTCRFCGKPWLDVSHTNR